MMVNWKNSATKAVIESDLDSGVLDLEVPMAREVWDQQYSLMQEFQEIMYEQFSRNLQAECKRFSKNLNQVAEEELMMQWD